MTNDAQFLGRNPLDMAIANVSAIQSRVMRNPDNHREGELLYALKCVLMELNQYFAGGYCSFADVFSNCGRIATLGMDIRHHAAGESYAEETLDSIAYDQQREEYDHSRSGEF